MVPPEHWQTACYTSSYSCFSNLAGGKFQIVTWNPNWGLVALAWFKDVSCNNFNNGIELWISYFSIQFHYPDLCWDNDTFCSPLGFSRANGHRFLKKMHLNKNNSSILLSWCSPNVKLKCPPNCWRNSIVLNCDRRVRTAPMLWRKCLGNLGMCRPEAKRLDSSLKLSN